MFVKQRELSNYERYLLEVKDRIQIDKYDSDKLFTLEKGLLGEAYFYESIKDCEGGAKIWDLRLNIKGESQYDFIIVSNKKIVHFDTKYYEGKYNYNNGVFMSEYNYVINNPLHKLDIQHNKLQELVRKLGINYEVLSYVIFVGEQFEVIGYKGDKRILFNKDLDRIVESLNECEVTEEEIQIARNLSAYYYDKGVYDRIYYYPFDLMRKGVKCPKCRRFLPLMEKNAKKVRCTCGCEYTKKEIVRLAFDAIHLLKNTSVTSGDIFDFTGVGKTTIKKVLSREYEKIGVNRSTAYVTSKSDGMLIKEEVYLYKVEVMKSNEKVSSESIWRHFRR
ncbi:NERD domain-containing protein [Macrococcoides bohemicum]|uniref:nuclease-related domain-containing protein n=1 Tax=Macrococcoides bohemicum TaxID=1903056 RepID=UPI001C5FCD30|nr:nuclease-related domain-containing protein [Macrococcus bohemicus]QYA44596.1 NERD domain-containing protein [Macrococcus bohemicus]